MMHSVETISAIAARLAIEARSKGSDGTDVQNPALIPGLVIGGVFLLCVILGLCIYRMKQG